MNLTKYIAAAAILGSVLVSSSFAEEANEKLFSGYFGGTAKTGYLSNGKLFVDDAVFQPYAGILFKGFNLDIWASQDLQNDAENGYEEIDYTLSYSGECGDISYTLGAVIWAYDDIQNDYRAFIDVAYNGLPVTVGAYARYNIANAGENDDGLYGQLKLSKGFELADGLNLGARVSVGYANSEYRTGWGIDADGFVDLEADVNLSYAVTEQLSVSTGCTFNSVMSSELRKNGGDNQADEESDHFIGYFGVNVDL